MLHQLVKKDTSCGSFVVLFHNFINKVAQKQKQDTVIHFFDQESQNGPIRYFNSSFLEKQKAEDILSGLKNGLMELSAKLSIPLHVSLDSPNMNWKVLALIWTEMYWP